MKILIGVGVAGVEWLLTRVADRIVPDATWLVLHVTERDTFAPMEGARFGLLGRGRRVEEALHRIQVTAHASADETIAAADRWLTEHGIRHQTLTREGQPEREIIRVAALEQVDLIVIDAGIVEEHPHGPGKHWPGRIAEPETDWLPPPPSHGPPPRPPRSEPIGV
jgi:nucleotide-binding universal stress UspA family protein